MKIKFIPLFFIVFCSCNEKKTNVQSTELLTAEKEVIMEYYNPKFKLDSTSNLRTDGYYEVKEYKTFNTDETDEYYQRPNFGFVHFFDDGFCRVGLWNGMRKYSIDVKKDFETNEGYVLNGLYQITADTLKIEYLVNSKNPIPGHTQYRNTMSGLISNDKIIFITGRSNYIYPYKQADTLTSRCIGTFKVADYDESNLTNYLKENIDNYLTDEK